jgi:GTPase
VDAPKASRSIVLLPVIQNKTADSPAAAASQHSPENKLAEAVGLAEAIDLEIADQQIIKLQQVRPATLFGKGKVEQLADLVHQHDAELVIVDHTVTPGQQRNLERAWNAKVLDRTGLILEIFGRRAQTREGRLQVELAHLTYQRGRLVRAWTHLERQRGGGGFIGGPGEAQIELDRRMIGARIASIRKELQSVVKTRELHRAGRRKVPYPIVALVGYTNAGKSTLFNALTGSDVFAKQQVFATLDPTMREVQLQSGRRVIISDTVGFISDLPTLLVAAFRATLEEVIEADVVLHVRDIAHPETEAQKTDVENVLNELGVSVTGAASNLIEVWNKTDLLEDDALEGLKSSAAYQKVRPILVSAVTGTGLERLAFAIDKQIGRNDQIYALHVPASAGKFVHWLHEHGDILQQERNDDGSLDCHVRIAHERTGAFTRAATEAGVDLSAQEHSITASETIDSEPDTDEQKKS